MASRTLGLSIALVTIGVFALLAVPHGPSAASTGPAVPAGAIPLPSTHAPTPTSASPSSAPSAAPSDAARAGGAVGTPTSTPAPSFGSGPMMHCSKMSRMTGMPSA